MTTKSDAHELLILLQLLSFDIKNTTRNRNKKNTYGKRRLNEKKRYYESELAKTDLYALNRS